MTFKLSFTGYLKSCQVATPSQQVIWHLQNYISKGVYLSLKGGAFSCAQWAPEPQLSVLYLHANIYEIQNVIHSLFTVKLDNVTIKT